MPNTTNQGLYYPATTDSPNLPSQMQTQNGTIENRLVQRFTSSADRATKRPTPTDGELSYLQDSDTYETYRNSAYEIVHRPLNMPSFSPVAGTYNSARPVQFCAGYVESTTASNSALSINPTPAGKTVSCVISAVATSSFKFGEPSGFQNTVAALDQVNSTTTSVTYIFYDVTNMGSGIGAAIVGFSYIIMLQTST